MSELRSKKQSKNTLCKCYILQIYQYFYFYLSYLHIFITQANKMGIYVLLLLCTCIVMFYNLITFLQAILILQHSFTHSLFPPFVLCLKKNHIYTMNTNHVYICTCICCEYPGRSGRGYLYDKGNISQINLSRMGACKECKSREMRDLKLSAASWFTASSEIEFQSLIVRRTNEFLKMSVSVESYLICLMCDYLVGLEQWNDH